MRPNLEGRLRQLFYVLFPADIRSHGKPQPPRLPDKSLRRSVAPGREDHVSALCEILSRNTFAESIGGPGNHHDLFFMST